MVSIQVLATPTRGWVRSSPVNPMALNMARDGARSRPSVIRRLRCFRSIGIKDYDSAVERESKELLIAEFAKESRKVAEKTLRASLGALWVPLHALRLTSLSPSLARTRPLR